MKKVWKRQIMAFITGKLDRFMRFWRADGWPKKKKLQIMVFITGNQGSIEIERDRDPAMTHVDPLAFPTLDPDRSILVRGTRPRPRIRLLWLVHGSQQLNS
jgi:hypothetical protein